MQMHGANACEVTFVYEDGRLGQVMLFLKDEPALAPAAHDACPFDADPDDFLLAARAQRLMLSPFLDPMAALMASNIEPLPHQVSAVYEELLPRTPLRFLLADDPGAGKTVMAGLHIMEQVLRGEVHRCLVVVPGALAEQWQDELDAEFGHWFEILPAGATDAAVADAFERSPLLSARMDQLARSQVLLEQVDRTEFDLVVVDEAHRMRASWFGGGLRETRRFQLGQRLSVNTRHLLLLTATPRNGKEADFQTLLTLLDRDRFSGRPDEPSRTTAAQGMMRRLVKESLVTFDSRPLFPERVVETLAYGLSPSERELYESVSDYVREGMDLLIECRATGART